MTQDSKSSTIVARWLLERCDELRKQLEASENSKAVAYFAELVALLDNDNGIKASSTDVTESFQRATVALSNLHKRLRSLEIDLAKMQSVRDTTATSVPPAIPPVCRCEMVYIDSGETQE